MDNEAACRNIAETAHAAIAQMVGSERAWQIMYEASGYKEAVDRSAIANQTAVPFGD